MVPGTFWLPSNRVVSAAGLGKALARGAMVSREKHNARALENKRGADGLRRNIVENKEIVPPCQALLWLSRRLIDLTEGESKAKT